MKTSSIVLATLYVAAMWHVQAMTFGEPSLDDNECKLQGTEDSCLNITGCAWCANATNYPGSLSMDGYGLCYHKKKGEKCCAVPEGGNGGETCSNGFPKVCTADETCSFDVKSTHYGPCYYPACCPPSKPVSCNGQCYEKGTKCCSLTTCKANQQCCDDEFQSGACCDLDGVCCAQAWNTWCCSKGSKCNWANFNCTKA